MSHSELLLACQFRSVNEFRIDCGNLKNFQKVLCSAIFHAFECFVVCSWFEILPQNITYDSDISTQFLILLTFSHWHVRCIIRDLIAVFAIPTITSWLAYVIVTVGVPSSRVQTSRSVMINVC